MSFNVNIVSLPIGDPAGADVLFAFQAPLNAKGGGITIQAASIVNGAATSGGTSFTGQLLKYSNAGTPAVNGTISDILGGSADEWADAVRKLFAISAGWVDAGEWVVFNYVEENSGNPTNAICNIHYTMGRAGN